MKFIFIPDSSDEFVPILCKYEDGKEVDNDLLKSKTLEYTGSEETVHETYIGKIYTSRFIFQCEDHKYYYEMKDVRLNDLCDQNPFLHRVIGSRGRRNLQNGCFVQVMFWWLSKEGVIRF